jgi:hypothetical protein
MKNKQSIVKNKEDKSNDSQSDNFILDLVDLNDGLDLTKSYDRE